MDSEKTKFLDKKFKGTGEVKDYHFMRIKETKLIALYKVSFKSFIHYEVFKRRVNVSLNKEEYPSSEEFGITAHTAPDKERAEAIFKTLQKEEKALIAKMKKSSKTK